MFPFAVLLPVYLCACFFPQSALSLYVPPYWSNLPRTFRVSSAGWGNWTSINNGTVYLTNQVCFLLTHEGSCTHWVYLHPQRPHTGTSWGVRVWSCLRMSLLLLLGSVCLKFVVNLSLSSVNKQHPWKKSFSFQIWLTLSCYWGVTPTSPPCTSHMCHFTPTGIYRWNSQNIEIMFFSKLWRHQMSHHTSSMCQAEATALGRQGIKSHHSFCHPLCLLSDQLCFSVAVGEITNINKRSEAAHVTIQQCCMWLLLNI